MITLYEGDAVRRHKENVIIATSTSPAGRKSPAIRRTLTAVGCTTALLAGVAACGTLENLTAGQKVDRAVEGLGEKKSLGFELGLDAAPSALVKLAGGAEPDDAMPAELAKFFTGVRVKVSVESRKPLVDSGEKDLVGTGMEFSGPDGVLAEYRLVGSHTYYRADMKALGEAVGFPLPTADELPEGGPDVRAVLEGKWVKIDNRELERAGKAAPGADEGGTAGTADTGGSSGKGADADGIDEKTQQKILEAVRSVVARQVAFSEKEGRDGGEVIVAKASFRDLLTGVFDKLRPLADELPAGAELPTGRDLERAPDRKVAVDFSLKNGDLTRVSVDLATLADDAKGARLPLVIEFGEAGDVSAPNGAEKMPLGELGQFGAPGNPFTTGLLGGV